MASSLTLVSFCQNSPVEALKAHSQALGNLNRPSVEAILRKINALALKSGSDFDKFEVLQLAGTVGRLFLGGVPSKAHGFFCCASRGPPPPIYKPKDQFKAYFLALFSDRDLGKVLVSLAKVDRSLRQPPIRGTPGFALHPCFRCDRVGH